MPYAKVSDLPDKVKNNLPKEAQKIYMEVYNSTAKNKDYDESACHAIAWTAVKKQYSKNKVTGKWKKKTKAKKSN
jgi:cation transport regulator